MTMTLMGHKPLVFELIDPAATLPAYAHSAYEDAGMDLTAVSAHTIAPGGRALVKTGLKVRLEPGYMAEVRSRSGLALTHGVAVLNSPGTIDPGYEGEIGVILFNAGTETFEVTPGMRVAQLVVMAYVPTLPVDNADLESGSEDTPQGVSRGDGGFGSTGV